MIDIYVIKRLSLNSMQLNAINWNEFLQKYKSSDLFIDETKVEEEEESVEPKNKLV